MSYSTLRKDLLDRLGVSTQALSMRARRRGRSDGPMSMRDATCLIAHDAGLHIDRYLEPDEVARMRSLVRKEASADGPSTRSTRRKPSKSQTHEIRFPGNFRLKGDLLPAGKVRQAVQMASVYPILYVLENSVREVIRRVMAEKYGEGWWETCLSKGRVKAIRDKALDRMATEEKKHAWHQRRGSHPIDYVDFGDLGKIVAARQGDFFPEVIPDRDVFEHTIIKQLVPSRNVLCHMNPLDDQSVTDIKSALTKWNRMISKTAGRPR